jgi:hypothetical protein
MYTKHRLMSFSLIGLLLVLLALALPSAAQDPCHGEPECYIPPTQVPSSRSQSGPAAPPWTGFNDGRLNPIPDEYYSLWCKHTFLEIWRGVPEGSLLQFVPIWLLDGLNANGGTATIPNYDLTPFTVTRQGDLITVAGNEGNFRPVAGEKRFSLSECIQRNDGPIGRAPDENNRTLNFVHSYVTVCYGRDSEVVRQGRVPPDQICQEGGSVVVTGPSFPAP